MARKYHKRNFVDAVEIITPDVYLEDDYALSGMQIKNTDLLVNSHVISAAKIQETLKISASALTGSNLYSSIDNINGLSQFFLVNNNLTNITPEKFQKKILSPLGQKLSSFSSSSAFGDYVSGTLLPKIYLNNTKIKTDTSSNFGSTQQEVTEYMISNLGWLYFLNTSAPAGGSLAPSTLVASSIVRTVYHDKDYKLNDALKDYQTYLWENYSSSSVPFDLLPSHFSEGTGTFTSGTQNLEKLKTLIDVAYSPLKIDKTDNKVETAFKHYLSATEVVETTEYRGPFSKFLRGASYGMFDINDQVEGIGDLNSIDECPSEYLPLLADIIGWKLYGRNTESWRNQIRNAPLIYRKKGTKQGIIDALNAIIPQNPINTSGTINELYESYLPNLIYYALGTGTDLFDSATFTQDIATTHGMDVFSPTDKDYNIRAGVDAILRLLATEFPDNFVLKGSPFRITRLVNGKGWFGPVIAVGANTWATAVYGEQGEILYDPTNSITVDTLTDTRFTFNYRNKVNKMPPWEEEKFYDNCIVTVDLLLYLCQVLQTFRVDANLITSLYDYVTNFVIRSTYKTDLYIGNSFLFYTSGQHYPPNQSEIFANYQDDKYDYLSLWSGKSSTFDFSISGGSFDSEVFQDSSSTVTTNDILHSLNIVDTLSPAKAIPRIRFTQGAGESASGSDYLCPSVRVGIESRDPSGNLGNANTSGVYDRSMHGSLGTELLPDFTEDLGKTRFSHQGRPVFKRSQASYRLGESQYVTSSVFTTDVVVPVASGVPRNALRRRNFYNAIDKKKWYTRTGSNMPCFYNNTGTLLDFVSLGYIPSAFSFATPDIADLSGVYSTDCSANLAGSTRNFYGVDTKNTFLTRAKPNEVVEFGSCDMYVRRDRIPQIVLLLYRLNEKKKKEISKHIYNYNYAYLAASANWVNFVDSFSNIITDDGLDMFYSPKLDKRTLHTRGLTSLYNTYNANFSGTAFAGLPESLAIKYSDGGANILSHTYGPTYKNANFALDGSALQTSSQLINDRLVDPFVINLAASSTTTKTIGMLTAESESSLYFGSPEYRTKHILSGIDFIDTSTTTLTPTNQFAIFDLRQQASIRNAYTYLQNNRTVLLRSRSHGLPRLRWGLRSTDEKNILVPESEYELDINYLTGNDNSPVFGGGSLGVMIHTKREVTKDGSGVCFVWNKNSEWEMVYVEDLQKEDSRELILQNYVHFFTDPTNQEDVGLSEGGDDESLLGLHAVQESSFSKAKIKFHTKNSKTNPPPVYATNYIASLSSVYNGFGVQVHRGVVNDTNRTQNYFVNVLQHPGSNFLSEEFLLLDSISLVNKTLNDQACIPYSAQIPDSSLSQKSMQTVKVLRPDGTELPTLKIMDQQSTGGAGGGGNSEDFPPTQNLIYAPASVEIDGLFAWDNALLGNRTTALAQYIVENGEQIPSSWAAQNRLKQLISYPYPATVNEWFCGRTGYSSLADIFDPTTYRMGLLTYFQDRSSQPTTITPPNTVGWDHYENYGLGVRPNSSPTSHVGYATLGSVGRWCDAIYDDESIITSQLNTNGPIRVDTLESRQGLLHPIRRPNSAANSSNVETHGFQLHRPEGLKNPLGYSITQDKQTLDYPNDGMYDTLLPIGSPIPMLFYSRRYHKDDEADNVYQRDRFIDLIENPLGKIDIPTYINSFPKLKMQDLLAINNVNNNLTLTQNFDSPYPSLNRTFDFNRHRPCPGFLYQDVPTQKLSDNTNYTFTIYIAKPHDIKPMEDDNVNLISDYEDKATSAMITLSPIDSSSSYVRLNLNLETEASSIQKGGAGTGLADSIAATCDKISYVIDGISGSEAERTLNWYRLKVTIPYSATEKADTYELDASLWDQANNNYYRQFNDGLRCSVFAYNGAYDGSLPVDGTPLLETGLDDDLTVGFDLAARVMLWGGALTAGSEPATWTRELGSFKVYHEDHPLYYYKAHGNVLDPGGESGGTGGGEDAENSFSTRSRRIFQDEDGELSYVSETTRKLEKLTVAVPTPENEAMPTTLYTQPHLFDNKDMFYRGDVYYDDNMRLERGDVYKYEGPGVNQYNGLHVSGGGTGSFITKLINSTINLEPRELLHLFRYFNSIGQKKRGDAFLTRVPSDSSEVHSVSGGSRISYRDNPNNDTIGTSGTTYYNFTNINVSG